MRKLAASFFALLLLRLLMPGSVQAQLLWEVSGKDLSKPSYLYGTIHISDQRVFGFGDSLMSKFTSCEVMAGELELSMNPATMMQLLPMVLMPNDTTLKDLLEPAQYKVVKEKLNEKLGLMAMFADKIKPLFLSTMIGDSPFGASEEKKPQASMPLDMYFQDLARKQGMKVVGLESMDEQMDAFNVISLKAQAEMLYSAVTNENEDGLGGMEEIIQIYLSQDIDKLYELTQGQLNDQVNDKLLVKRNHNMVERSLKIMQQQPVFVAVGAAHLSGPEGLIALFRKQGYTVEAVR